jgi:dethiobiotin synthetase
VFAFKPIETGTDAELGADQVILVAAAGGWQTGDLRGPYRYSMPVAPLFAAVAERRPIDLDRIDRVFAEGASRADFVVVEGAGGLRVPVTEEVDMAGLAARLDLPLVIVARAGLGTINHSLLTIEAAERSDLDIAAVVLSKRPEDDEVFAQSNAAEIRRRWAGRVFLFDGTADGLAPLVEPADE